MRLAFRTLFKKTIAVILLTAAVVLFCPVSQSLAYSPTDSCEIKNSMSSGHKAATADEDCSGGGALKSGRACRDECRDGI